MEQIVLEKRNQAVKVNPFCVGTFDDTDAYFEPEEEICIKTLPQADEHGQFQETPTQEKKKRSVIIASIQCFKYIYSMLLLGFCVVLVMACIFDESSTAVDYNISPTGAFFLFWFLICWLAVIEGGQGCLVGLQPIEKTYEESHPRAFKTTHIAHKGDNMERFIVGRQFLAVIVLFLINLCGSSLASADPLKLPLGLNIIFLDNGVAMMITTIVLGQLTSQMNAAVCMLDFINNYFMLFTTYVSLGIEMSGLLHSGYLVQYGFAAITGSHVESNETTRNFFQNIFFWFRVLMSSAILAFALAVTLRALLNEQSGMWEGVPASVSIVIFFVLLCVVGLMEGMQIAAFALINMPEDELQTHKVAYSNCKLMFSGQNLQAFLIGRQIFAASLMFIVARIATIDIPEDEKNIFGVSNGFQTFLDTGLLGAVVLTIIGSLIWRIVASSYPLAFMSNPVIYIIIKVCLIIEKTGICSSSWVLARFHKIVVGYQPDEVYLEGAERHSAEPVTKRDKEIDITVTVAKYIYSFALLFFCVVIIMSALFTKNTTLAQDTHPSVAFLLFWFLICWLAMAEGGQGCLVGLQPIKKNEYANSHPRTFKNTSIAHKGDNMERFIVGRQFLVVLIIFLINMSASPVGDTSVLGLDGFVTTIFLDNGVAMMITTIVLGQLTSQVNAAACMLDFINNYFMLFTTYVSLGIEMSGLLHSVYLVQIAFSKLVGKPIETKEPPRSRAACIFFWFRVLMSSAILAFALAVTLRALLNEQSGMWEGVPASVSIVIFFVLLCVVGLMEGMQIAAFALLNFPEDELKKHAVASANCKLMFSGQNLQAFLIGRQIFAASLMFIVAKIATIDIKEGEKNIFGVSNGFQTFLDTGLLGAVVLTIIGSLAWRIVASSYPLAFMSNPVVFVTIRICMFLEGTGICSAAWFLALIVRSSVGYQSDEVYIENDEDEEISSQSSYPDETKMLENATDNTKLLLGQDNIDGIALKL